MQINLVLLLLLHTQSVQNHRLNKLQSYSLPSARYVNLSLVNAENYTAPADGWFCAGRYTTGQAQLSIFNTTTELGMTTTNERTAHQKVYCPVKKGHIVKTTFWQGQDPTYLRFVYAEGSEPQT